MRIHVWTARALCHKTLRKSGVYGFAEVARGISAHAGFVQFHGRVGVFMEVGTSSVQMLPYTASSVGVARRRLIGDLTNAGVFEATACDAGLVLSELISNALRHATPLPGSLVKVSWRLKDGCVEVAVSDGGGSTVPMVNRPAANALGGRGLGIVDRLSLRWGVHTLQDGSETTVWAVVPLSGDAEASAESVAENGPRDHNGSGPNLVIASSRDA
jgi:anti-sigma regulatory factor (Ser/Thr protein kinase)